MDYKEIYWIFVAESLGYGNNKIKNILEQYKGVENFYKDKNNSWKFAGFLTRKNIESLKSNLNLEKANKIFNKCKKLGYKVITIEDSRYPNKLKNISNPPAVLYVNGDLPNIDNKLCISVVGTRNSTSYGNKTSFEMGYHLAKSGVIVVSGAAVGIDCISQKGALQARGKTIAVLGCGINFQYLMANKNLRDNIAKNGAVISEYPPDYHTARWTFPLRNRIISGLSDGTLVVEADKKSGSLITAKLALEQNRDLFAVPGNINVSTSEGTNELIKICAKPVMTVKDILEEYYHLYPYLNNKVVATKKNKEIKKQNKLPDGLSKRARLIFEKLTDKPVYSNDLALLSGLSVSEVLQAVTELELYNCIKVNPGKRYSRP